jgi:hypothetical protein
MVKCMELDDTIGRVLDIGLKESTKRILKMDKVFTFFLLRILRKESGELATSSKLRPKS